MLIIIINRELNIYYFEASNGTGKARNSIIDSPANGPVLFSSDFSKNEIVLISKEKSEVIWRYSMGKEWIGGVSLSDDGYYIATATGCPDRRAYIFSRDSNEPLVRSEMLTRDSPVDESIISADGSFAVFGSESSDGAVFLFSIDSKEPVWKFTTPDNASVRALGFTPDSMYIGAATMFGGNVYIFSKDSNQPVNSWNIKNVSLGALDIADDGSYLAVGGTDNKVHIFERNNPSQNAEFDLNEFAGEIDISAASSPFCSSRFRNNIIKMLYIYFKCMLNVSLYKFSIF